jgi:hypothetical protein
MVFARPDRRANAFMEYLKAGFAVVPFSLLRNEMNRDLPLAGGRG